MKKLILLFALAFMATAQAQTPVRTLPYAVTSSNPSTTIGGTNTFQSVWPAFSTSPNSKQRAGCTIQNTGTHTMLVFFGPIASATTSNSFQISPGQTISCTVGGIILQDQVSITGTAGDTFVAAQQ